MPLAYLALAALLGFFFIRVLRDLEEPVRKRAVNWTLTAIFLAALALVLLRFGFQWLVLLAAAAGALLRYLWPLVLRSLPLAFQMWLRHKQEKTGRSTREGQAPPARTRMTRKEALEVLGLKEGASREEILASYKNLIKKVHPDSPGGSNYLASKINQAKNVLLP